MINVRHSSSRELLIATRPQPALVLRMTAAPYALQPSSAGLLKSMKIEAHSFKRPGGCTRTACVSRPNILM